MQATYAGDQNNKKTPLPLRLVMRIKQSPLLRPGRAAVQMFRQTVYHGLPQMVNSIIPLAAVRASASLTARPVHSSIRCARPAALKSWRGRCSEGVCNLSGGRSAYYIHKTHDGNGKYINFDEKNQLPLTRKSKQAPQLALWRTYLLVESISATEV